MPDPKARTRRARPDSGARRLRRRRRALRRRLVLAGVLLVVVIAVVMLIFNSGDTTVVALYLGDERFAYIDADVTEADIMTEAVRRLGVIQEAEVQITETITLREVSRSEQGIILPINEVIERLVTAINFQVIGISIELNNRPIAVLRNQTEVDEVAWTLQSPFIEGNRDRFSTIEFVEDFRTTRATVPTSELASVSYALHLLGGSVVEMQEYIVQPGENMSIIAANHGISLAQMFADNPQVPSNGEIGIGEVLQVRQTRPYLSVRTVEEVTRREYIEIDDDEQLNPGAPVGFYLVLMEGERGEREIVSEITRVNGIQQGAENIIANRVITEMIYRVVEVGTGGD